MAAVKDPAKTMFWGRVVFSQEIGQYQEAACMMDCVWYAIACTDKNVADQKLFWEHWYWNDDMDRQADKELHAKKKRRACKHALT